MQTITVQPPLTNLQFELLKIFQRDLPEEHLIEIRDMISKFLLQKAREKASKIWNEKKYTPQLIEEKIYAE